MSIKISKKNKIVNIPYKIWLDMLAILYLRNKEIFYIYKDYTEQLNQEEFDMGNVNYKEKKRRFKK